MRNIKSRRRSDRGSISICSGRDPFQFAQSIMFDIECYYMGETEEFSERFFEPSGHHLEIVPRSSWRGQRIYMLNADATADWLELS